MFEVILLFYILIYERNNQKNFFDQNIPKIIFGQMSCVKRYNFG
jgi:hypothetical protein